MGKMRKCALIQAWIVWEWFCFVFDLFIFGKKRTSYVQIVQKWTKMLIFILICSKLVENEQFDCSNIDLFIFDQKRTSRIWTCAFLPNLDYFGFGIFEIVLFCLFLIIFILRRWNYSFLLIFHHFCFCYFENVYFCLFVMTLLSF